MFGNKDLAAALLTIYQPASDPYQDKDQHDRDCHKLPAITAFRIGIGFQFQRNSTMPVGYILYGSVKSARYFTDSTTTAVP